MFKFPEVNKVHFQCDIILCKTDCPQLQCNGENSLKGSDDKEFVISKDSIQLLASTTVFVIEPGAQLCKYYTKITFKHDNQTDNQTK